jgi:hypothetical protein
MGNRESKAARRVRCAIQFRLRQIDTSRSEPALQIRQVLFSADFANAQNVRLNLTQKGDDSFLLTFWFWNWRRCFIRSDRPLQEPILEIIGAEGDRTSTLLSPSRASAGQPKQNGEPKGSPPQKGLHDAPVTQAAGAGMIRRFECRPAVAFPVEPRSA